MSEAPNEQGVIHTDEPQEPPALPAEATGDHETLTVRKLGWVVGTASSKGKLAALLTSADRKQEAITKAKARAQKRADVSGNVIRLVVCDSDGNPQRGYYFHPTPPSEDD